MTPTTLKSHINPPWGLSYPITLTYLWGGTSRWYNRRPDLSTSDQVKEEEIWFVCIIALPAQVAFRVGRVEQDGRVPLPVRWKVRWNCIFEAIFTFCSLVILNWISEVHESCLLVDSGVYLRIKKNLAILVGSTFCISGVNSFLDPFSKVVFFDRIAEVADVFFFQKTKVSVIWKTKF